MLENIERYAKLFPNQAAIETPSSQVSWKELLEYVEAYEVMITQVEEGQKIALTATPTIENIAFILAALRKKRIICPLSPRYTLAQIEEALERLSARMWDGDKFTYVAGDTRLEGVATCLFTSGSTAKPKIVCSSLDNHFYNAAYQHPEFGLDHTKRYLLSLPLSHVSGLSILFRACIFGFTILLPETKDLAKTINTMKPTHLSLVPSQLIDLTSDVLTHQVDATLVGGTKLSKHLLAARSHLNLFPTYGMTEMASQVYTKGVILPHRELKMNASDEVYVKGPPLFMGYLKDGKLTLPLDEEGFFATGDVGELVDGELEISHRKDRLLISGGENIAPQAIEEIIATLEGVMSVEVIARKDQIYGERPVAYVGVNKELGEDQIRQILGDKLERFQIPDEFIIYPV
ncbi:MAG: 2-succinylbenzoate--CoA ligase [Chlamydiia bacterium]|nr:2-succinylbenzoate--CoA ligase [Chlamydiia bacterium]